MTVKCLVKTVCEEVGVFFGLITEIAEGNTDLAQQRMEDLICLSAAALAGLMHIPTEDICGIDAKKRVKKYDISRILR